MAVEKFIHKMYQNYQHLFDGWRLWEMQNILMMADSYVLSHMAEKYSKAWVSKILYCSTWTAAAKENDWRNFWQPPWWECLYQWWIIISTQSWEMPLIFPPVQREGGEGWIGQGRVEHLKVCVNGERRGRGERREGSNESWRQKRQDWLVMSGWRGRVCTTQWDTEKIHNAHQTSETLRQHVHIHPHTRSLWL